MTWKTTRTATLLWLGALLALAGCAATPPPGGQGDDAAITAKIKAQLIASAELASFPVNVSTSQGVVQLSGRVDRKVQRKAIERLARSVSGVRAVRDDIVVQRVPKNADAPAVSDAELITQVKATLSGDPTINPLAIQVSIRAGVVTLSGRVSSTEQSQRAEELVRRIAGIRGVDNQLEVTKKR